MSIALTAGQMGASRWGAERLEAAYACGRLAAEEALSGAAGSFDTRDVVRSGTQAYRDMLDGSGLSAGSALAVALALPGALGLLAGCARLSEGGLSAAMAVLGAAALAAGGRVVLDAVRYGAFGLSLDAEFRSMALAAFHLDSENAVSVRADACGRPEVRTLPLSRIGDVMVEMKGDGSRSLVVRTDDGEEFARIVEPCNGYRHTPVEIAGMAEAARNAALRGRL